MTIIVNTIEQLEDTERELVQNKYRLTDITEHALIYTKFKSGIKHEVKLKATFWKANEGQEQAKE